MRARFRLTRLFLNQENREEYLRGFFGIASLAFGLDTNTSLTAMPVESQAPLQ